jgi:hypothetical protein
MRVPIIKLIRYFLRMMAVSCFVLAFAFLGFYAIPAIYNVVLVPRYPILNQPGKNYGIPDLLLLANASGAAYIGFVAALFLLRKMKVIDLSDKQLFTGSIPIFGGKNGCYSSATIAKLMRHFLLVMAVSWLILFFVSLGFVANPALFFYVLEPRYPVLDAFGRFAGLIQLVIISNAFAGAYMGFVIALLLLRKMKVINEMPIKFLERLFPSNKD